MKEFLAFPHSDGLQNNSISFMKRKSGESQTGKKRRKRRDGVHKLRKVKRETMGMKRET